MPKLTIDVPEGDVALAEDVLRMVESAPEPGDFTKDKVVFQGDTELPMTIVKGNVTSAGYINVYNMETGEPSVINKNMMMTQLKKKLGDGRMAFTTRKELAPTPFRGTFKCMLHPDDLHREHYSQMGMPVCIKSNIPNDYELLNHMRKKHKTAWAQIERERQDADRIADRAWQNSLIAIAQGRQDTPPQPAPALKSYICEECGKSLSTPLALSGHKRSHK